ncbi:MAG: bifunctional riboflavin kinase/FAD synthetase [Desulfococcaceae bacterium]|jgi:riboflavin kinase/FMN adenylyltransferase|nr:bifunctional riboflavin kinase/FAD synthetase [Desulfococcaceae bacterium]
MKIIEGIDKIEKPFENAVITIGNFDGVHLGHQALFHEVIEKADKIGGVSLAITFEPHPMRVLRRNGHPPLITLYEQKTELIERTGIDYLLNIPFTKEFAAISAQDFLEKILIGRIGMKAFVVGGDYSFGRNRQGDLAYLRQAAKRFAFDLIVADWIQPRSDGSERISSTRIREVVMEGDMEWACKMLGRYYQIRGTVARGRNRGGKLLGCPTANINLHDELAPKTGVYAVIAEVQGQRFKGVANIGYSPTFDDHIFTVEVHLLDFDRNIYGQKIRVNFVQRIRDEKKFSGIEELSAQIRKDIRISEKLLCL